MGFTQDRNARIGRILFGIYAFFYGSFVLLNAYSPASSPLLLMMYSDH